MAVRIRMKKMGRAHRHFFRICATDKHSPRDGKVLEELGTYDPMIADADARVVMKNDRVDYWLSVGAQPSEKVAILIKKYGTDGTRVEEHRAAREKLSMPVDVAEVEEVAAPEPEAPAPAAEGDAEPKAEGDAPAAEASEEAKAEEAPAAEAPAEEEAKSE